MRQIKRAGVVGAGVMGATIAAHLANVGMDVVLLDIVPPGAAPGSGAGALRNALAARGLKQALASKPTAFYVKDISRRITIGNLDDDLGLLRDVDWIVEVVVEQLVIKRALYEKLETVLGDDTLITSNTSGIPAGALCEGRNEIFRRNFAITHFFNPPRYLKLIELVAGPDTDPQVMKTLAQVCEGVLGKGVVRAKDTPNFIANRIGLFSLFAVIRAMEKHGLSVEDVDAVTGTLIGRAKSASFRTLDLVGLDTVAHAAENVLQRAPDEDRHRELFALPPLVARMLKEGRLGEKSGGGFYKKGTDSKGNREILSIDPSTGEYRPKTTTRFKSVGDAKRLEKTRDRIGALYAATDPAGLFTFDHLSDTLLYAADRLAEIAGDPATLDNAMKWGFGWRHGPFEIWDMLGVAAAAEAMKKSGREIPPWVLEMLDSGVDHFYTEMDGIVSGYQPQIRSAEPISRSPKIVTLDVLRHRGNLVETNPGASLLDLGDGVACLEFHSKMNAIGEDITRMIDRAVVRLRTDFDGLVIANHGDNFSVGANLPVVLFAAQEEEWDDIDWMVRNFQNTLMGLKYTSKPVVAAPAGMALGGGCEICLAADRVRFAGETYMGLVEVGVGLIPAGGGTKEMFLRSTEGLFWIPPGGVHPSQIDLKPFVSRAFETIARARVSTSGLEAVEIGYLRASDRMTVNRDYLIHDAKRTVLAMNLEGYTPPDPTRRFRAPGRPLKAMFDVALRSMRDGGFITAHDEVVCQEVGHVLCGGDIDEGTMVTEQYLLDLEREAFLKLCGYPQTQARIEHILKTGKPLRN